MASRHTIKKLFNNFKGVNKRFSALQNSEGYATDINNATYLDDGSISKRRGYSIVGGGVGSKPGFGASSFLNQDFISGTEIVETLFVGNKLLKKEKRIVELLYTGEMNEEQGGAYLTSKAALLTTEGFTKVFTLNSSYKNEAALWNDSLDVNYELGEGLGSNYVSLLKRSIESVPNFTLTDSTNSHPDHENSHCLLGGSCSNSTQDTKSACESTYYCTGFDGDQGDIPTSESTCVNDRNGSWILGNWTSGGSSTNDAEDYTTAFSCTTNYCEFDDQDGGRDIDFNLVTKAACEASNRCYINGEYDPTYTTQESCELAAPEGPGGDWVSGTWEDNTGGEWKWEGEGVESGFIAKDYPRYVVTADDETLNTNAAFHNPIESKALSHLIGYARFTSELAPNTPSGDPVKKINIGENFKNILGDLRILTIYDSTNRVLLSAKTIYLWDQYNQERVRIDGYISSTISDLSFIGQARTVTWTITANQLSNKYREFDLTKDLTVTNTGNTSTIEFNIFKEIPCIFESPFPSFSLDSINRHTGQDYLENASFASSLGALYIASYDNYLMKYDGKRLYRAGLPAPHSISVSNGQHTSNYGALATVDTLVQGATAQREVGEWKIGALDYECENSGTGATFTIAVTGGVIKEIGLGASEPGSCNMTGTAAVETQELCVGYFCTGGSATGSEDEAACNALGGGATWTPATWSGHNTGEFIVTVKSATSTSDGLLLIGVNEKGDITEVEVIDGGLGFATGEDIEFVAGDLDGIGDILAGKSKNLTVTSVDGLPGVASVKEITYPGTAFQVNDEITIPNNKLSSESGATGEFKFDVATISAYETTKAWFKATLEYTDSKGNLIESAPCEAVFADGLTTGQAITVNYPGFNSSQKDIEKGDFYSDVNHIRQFDVPCAQLLVDGPEGRLLAERGSAGFNTFNPEYTNEFSLPANTIGVGDTFPLGDTEVTVVKVDHNVNVGGTYYDELFVKEDVSAIEITGGNKRLYPRNMKVNIYSTGKTDNGTGLDDDPTKYGLYRKIGMVNILSGTKLDTQSSCQVNNHAIMFHNNLSQIFHINYDLDTASGGAFNTYPEYKEVFDAGGKGLPPKAKYIASHQNCLILGNIQNTNNGDFVNNPNQIIWTPNDSPEYFPLYNYTTVPGEVGDYITGIKGLRDLFYVFQKREIQALAGDFGTGSLRNVTLSGAGDIGCVANSSITEVGGNLLFLDEKGIYSINSVAAPQEISAAINTEFKPLLKNYSFSKACGFDWSTENKFILSIPKTRPSDVSSSGELGVEDSITYVYEYFRNAWTKWDNFDLIGGAVEDEDQRLYFVSKHIIDQYAEIYSWVKSVNQEGTPFDYVDHINPINFEYKTNWEHMGEPSLFKRFLKLKVHSIENLDDYSLSGFNLHVSAEKDFIESSVGKGLINFKEGVEGFGSGEFGTNKYGASPWYALKTKLPFTKAKSYRINFSNAELNEGVMISGYELEVAMPYKTGIKE